MWTVSLCVFSSQMYSLDFDPAMVDLKSQIVRGFFSYLLT